MGSTSPSLSSSPPAPAFEASHQAKKRKNGVVKEASAFDYSALEGTVAERIRTAADRIRQKVKRTVEDIIQVGKSLIAVKESLPHGQFGPWLQAEFGWAERTARNFMGVAELFGSKTAIISDFHICPTAAYLLAAPSAPDEARLSAIERANAGEQITPTVAKEILSAARKKSGKEPKRDNVAANLLKALERYRDRWNPKKLTELAQTLRQFLQSLENR